MAAETWCVVLGTAPCVVVGLFASWRFRRGDGDSDGRERGETRVSETCEHGLPMDGECDECGRFPDGSDGTTAGDYRARRKAWREYLEDEERYRRSREEGYHAGVFGEW